MTFSYSFKDGTLECDCYVGLLASCRGYGSGAVVMMPLGPVRRVNWNVAIGLFETGMLT